MIRSHPKSGFDLPKHLHNQRSFQALIEHSLDGLVLLDHKGSLLYISPTALKLFGYSHSQLIQIGDPFSYIHPEDLEVVQKAFAQVLANPGLPVSSEFRVRHSDGHYLWLESVATNLLYNPDIKAIINNFRDITQHKLTEIILTHQKERLRLAQEVGRIGTFEWDFKHSLLYWSQELEQIHGLTPGSFGGKESDWEALVHPDDLQKIKDDFSQQLTQSDQVEQEYRIIAPDKSVRWVRSTSKIFRDHAGEPSKCIGISVDITDRKQSELNTHFLSEASKILSSSLEYQTTLNNIAMLAVPQIADWCSIDLLDKEGQLQQVAVAHKDPEKVKWAKESRKARPVNMQQKTGVANVIRTGKSEFIQEITDSMIKSTVKTTKDFNLIKSLGLRSVIIVPIFSQSRPVGAITFVNAENRRLFNLNDLSVAKELALRASLSIENSILYRESQKAISIRDDFISIASHELKTPVTSIKIFSEVLKQRAVKAGDMVSVEALNKMDRQLKKLHDLIHDLLDISRIQSGRMEYQTKLFDINNTIKEVVDVLQQSSFKHKISVTTNSSIKVLGDEDRIGQVISNFISNAIKYSPESDKIEVTVNHKSNQAIVEVKDFGIGISNEHINKVFDRFYRVFDANNRTFPGLGIGLYISAEIIKRHKGKIWVNSKVGEGSSFYFSLPLKSTSTSSS